MMQYVDRDGFVWEGAAINCLDCMYYDTVAKGKCNDYDSRGRYCRKFSICEDEIRVRFGVGMSDAIECSDWRPGN